MLRRKKFAEGENFCVRRACSCLERPTNADDRPETGTEIANDGGRQTRSDKTEANPTETRDRSDQIRAVKKKQTPDTHQIDEDIVGKRLKCRRQ